MVGRDIPVDEPAIMALFHSHDQEREEVKDLII